MAVSVSSGTSTVHQRFSASNGPADHKQSYPQISGVQTALSHQSERIFLDFDYRIMLLQGSLHKEAPLIGSALSFDQLQAKKILSDSISASAMEKLILKEMFKKWHFSTDMDLIHLIGMDIFDELNGLRSERFTEVFQSLVDQYCAEFLVLYISMHRFNMKNAAASDDTGSYFASKDEIVQQADQFTEALSKYLSDASATEEYLTAGSPSASEEVAARYKSFAHVAKRISAKIALLKSLHSSGHSFKCLVRSAPVPLRASPPPDYAQKQAEALVQIQTFANYYCNLFSAALKKEKVRLQTSLLKEWADAIATLNGSPVAKETVLAIKGKMHDDAQILVSMISNAQIDLEEAESGVLTEAAWRKRFHLEKASKNMSRGAFIEFMRQNFILIKTMEYYLDDLHLILDKLIFKPVLPDFIPFYATVNRLTANMCPDNHQAVTSVASGPSNLFRDFRMAVRSKVARMESLFDPLISDEQFQEMRDYGKLAKMREASLPRWIITLTHFEEYFPLLDKVKSSLQTCRQELIDLFQLWSGGLDLQEREDLKRRCEQICFDESGMLLCKVMILEDMRSILEKEFFCRPRRFLPGECVDFIALEPSQKEVEKQKKMKEDPHASGSVSAGALGRKLSQTMKSMENPSLLAQCFREAVQAVLADPVEDEPLQRTSMAEKLAKIDRMFERAING